MKKCLKLIKGKKQHDELDIANLILSLIVAAVAVYSLYHLIKLIKKYGVLEILSGMAKLSSEESNIVDISNKRVKFLGRQSDEAMQSFDQYLARGNYQHVARFGKSDLYDLNGSEVVVKKTPLFNRFYLFEIFNDEYFQS